MIKTVQRRSLCRLCTAHGLGTHVYFDDVWSNVELYLLGCRYGIAIVEDRFKPELNPNVAMEWGWMRGLGKDVLFLVEKQAHKFVSADWSA